MKYCPNCQTRYTDNTLRFCLQDGAPLVDEADESSSPTVAYGEPVQLNETETIISSPRSETPAVEPRTVEPLRIDLPAAPEPQRQPQYQSPQIAPAQTAAPPRNSKTLPLILLTALATLLLAGVGAWLYSRNNRAEVVKNASTNMDNQSSVSNTNAKSNAKNSTAPTASPKNETNANAVNANNSTPAPNVDREQIKGEIADRVDSWKSLTESRNLNGYMGYYADTVDYYNKRGASASFIRGDKQRAFNDFDSIEMNISNINVTPDATGERATAVFDKEWVFGGEEKSSSGKVRTELQMRKINGKWLITSERDLKVYYIK